MVDLANVSATTIFESKLKNRLAFGNYSLDVSLSTRLEPPFKYDEPILAELDVEITLGDKKINKKIMHEIGGAISGFNARIFNVPDDFPIGTIGERVSIVIKNIKFSDRDEILFCYKQIGFYIYRQGRSIWGY
jgi:hypothetical protein